MSTQKDVPEVEESHFLQLEKDPASTSTLNSKEEDYFESLQLDDPYYLEVEKKVVRKFDLVIIPCLCIAYLFSNLDKANIGNAEAAGLSKDLGLTENEFGNVVSLLFVPYVVFETPIALSLKYIGAKYALSTMVLLFGIVGLCTAFVTGYHSLLACRMLLGFFESGIIPVINVYLGMLYTRKEMAKRCSAVYSASAMAGGFGGLLAFGLIQINAHGWEGWRWLFAIEGALTIISTPILVVLLPNGKLTETWWLTKEERQVLAVRISKNDDFYQEERFQISEVKRSLLDINNIVLCAYEFCVDLTLFGISTFLPSIIRGMGYDKYETQLLTIPFYAIAWLSFVTVSYFSDRLSHRGSFLIGGLLFEIVGYAVLIGSNTLGVRYFGCMMLGVGIFVCSALSIMWVNNNNAGHYKRATIGGMITTIGSCAGVLAGQIYTADTSPRYFKGLKIALSLTCVAVPMVCFVMWNHDRVNKKRDMILEAKRAKGDIDEALGQPKDDRDVHYRFIL